MTKEFVERAPFVWPGVNIPTPFGRTPLFDQLQAEERVLTAMPFAFYYNPYLTFIPVHYSAVEYYRNLIDLFDLITSRRMWMRRLTTGAPGRIKFVHSVQTFGMLAELKDLRRILSALEGDGRLRAFHAGRSAELPGFYQQRFDEMLGDYAPLLSREDRLPLLAVPVPA